MTSPSPQPILIFSAGFGDGHNAAARSIQQCISTLTNGETVPPIIDLFAEGLPTVNAFLKWGYVFLTTHFPRGWRLLYDHADRSEPTKIGWDWLGGLPSLMARHLVKNRPQVIISTYPLYPHLLANVLPGLPQPQHVFSVVTDSLEINSVWTKAPSDRFFVTDEGSQELLVKLGIPSERVANVGFAVGAAYRGLVRQTAGEGRLRLLLFATSSARRVTDTLRGLLESSLPAARLTIVLGRHEKRLRPAVEATLRACGSAAFPVEIIGWTDAVPQLLAEHDLVLSKAGGATTHECFALGVPMLVTHAIPGQEEGNARLLELRGCGWRCEEPAAVGPFIAAICQDGRYAAAQQQMQQFCNPHGAWSIAQEAIQASK